MLPLLGWLLLVGSGGALVYLGTAGALGASEAHNIWRRARGLVRARSD
jgi:hypothetical protein